MVRLIFLAVTARLAMFLLIEPTAAGDGIYYLRAAEQGPDLYRPPLYPLLVAITWPLTHIAQSIIAAGTALFAYRMTRSFSAAGLIACCPFLIVYEWAILSETLLICLLLAGWLFLDRGRALWSGLCVGLAILTNDVLLLFPLFALPIGWWLGKARNFALMAAVAYLTLLPFAAYNAVTHDRFALSEGRLGFNLWVGTWERNGDWVRDGIRADRLPDYAFRDPSEKTHLLSALASGNDAAFREAAIDRIKSDPTGTIKRWTQRYWRLWLGTRTDQAQLRLETGSFGWLMLKSAAWGLNLVLLVSGIAALISSRRWIWAIPPLYFAAIYLPFHNTETRYSLPALVILLVPLGLTFPNWVDALRRRWTGYRLPLGSD